MPATLRLTKYGTCAFTWPACMSWMTCQPPRPSGTETLLVNEPSAAAVPLPSGTETKLQHVPVQLTRLPTTVDQTRSTGAPGVRPAAETSTLERMGPAVELRRALAEPAPRFAADSVVLASSVGATLAGQSSRCRGRPASLLTLNEN